MDLEPLSADNFDEFVALMQELADFEKLERASPEAIERLREDGLANKRFEGYVVRIEGKAVAYLTLVNLYSSFLGLPTLYIEDVYVVEAFRGKGIGQKLFDFCKKLAKERGCGRLDFVVLDWNTGAQQFYEKNGAEKMQWQYYRLTKFD